MAEAFRVDPEALADAVEQMADFQRCSESLFSEIDSLLRNLHLAWSGKGATAHAEAHRHWSRGEAMMREALAQLQAAGMVAHAIYTSVAPKNLDMWSRANGTARGGPGGLDGARTLPAPVSDWRIRTRERRC